MEMNLANLAMTVFGAVISGALVSVARGLSGLNIQVATLNAQVAQIRGDLDLIKGNYVSTDKFRDRVDRMEKDMNGIGSKCEKIYCEHISCAHCKPAPGC